MGDDVSELPAAFPAVPAAAKKRCITCGLAKTVDEFYRLHKDSEHRQSRCKRCDNLVRMHGIRVARGLLEAAGAAHQLDLQREREARTPPLLRVLSVARAISPGEEEGEEWKPPARPVSDDEVEARLFGAIAGAYMLAGVRAAVAWERANEWLDEHPGQLPEGFEALPPEPKRRGASPFLTTPTERLREMPKNVERLVPREDSAGVVDPEDGLPVVGNVAQLPPRDEPEEADELVDRLMAENRPTATTKRVLQPRKDSGVVATVAPPTTATIRARTGAPGPDDAPNSTPPKKTGKDTTMAFTEEVYEALAKAGNATAEELANKMGADRLKVTNALRSLLAGKRADRHGGHKGAHWEVGTGKSTKGDGSPKLPAKTKKPRAKANGAARTNGHAALPAPTPAAADPVAAALFALRDALTNKHTQQMSAIETLLKG